MYYYSSLNISFLKYFNFLHSNFLQITLMIQLRTFQYSLKSRKYPKHNTNIDLSVFVAQLFFPISQMRNIEEKKIHVPYKGLYSLDITHSLGSWSLQEVFGCICVSWCILRHTGLIFLCYLPINSLHAESPTPEQLQSITSWQEYTYCY